MSTLVNWTRYAQDYDLLLAYNPFYQALKQDVIAHIGQWPIGAEAQLIDMGAGTGNYSLEMARMFPQAEVIHVDQDKGMNEIARSKFQQADCQNVRIIPKSVDEVDWEANSIDGLICIHALYTFADPAAVLFRFYEWLKPGGKILLVDPGRKVKVWDWQWAIARHLISQYGLLTTWKLFRRGKEVSRQNKRLSRMQARGELWLHTHEEFCEMVQSTGFQIVEAKTVFRDISDWVLAVK